MIIGIDPGLECTGWALLNSQRQCIGYDGIKSKASDNDSDRIVTIEDGLEAVVLNLLRDSNEPLVAAVEQYVFQGEHSKNANAFRVSRLVGSIERLFRGHLLTVVGFTRGQALTAIGLRPNAKEAEAKRVIARLVKSKGGSLPSNEHSRAAYAQAWAAAGRARP